MTAAVPDPASSGSATAYNPDWADASHAKLSTPNYAEAYPQAAVNTIEITMTAAQWNSIREDMKVLYGFDFGSRAAGAGGGFPDEDPAYVAVAVKYKGKTWKQVGFRLKGNSTLSSSWSSGNWKLPFRLKTSEFEDVYPAVKSQRFYGFKDISFSPGRNDPALLREKVTAELFRSAGVPAAQTAFYRVYVDFGAGQKYLGVYTAVEVIDDTMVKNQFGEDKGNIYKPESAFVRFVAGEFEKKNNESAADYSDVQAFITALNSPLRTTNPAQWRASLEATFNVEHFLKWLAVNNAIVNWDSYGAIAHNYYLYNSPAGKLTWIPWDHNEAMTGSPGITGSATTPGAGAAGPARGLSLTMNEVGQNWPLLRFLADDPVYFARYKALIKAFNDGPFDPATVSATFDRYHAMISPYVTGAGGEQADATYTSAAQFTSGLASLKAHVRSRHDLVATFVP
jgi:hypothetical protein